MAIISFTMNSYDTLDLLVMTKFRRLETWPYHEATKLDTPFTELLLKQVLPVGTYPGAILLLTLSTDSIIILFTHLRRFSILDRALVASAIYAPMFGEVLNSITFD